MQASASFASSDWDDGSIQILSVALLEKEARSRPLVTHKGRPGALAERSVR
jgi:hypothetical protein